MTGSKTGIERKAAGLIQLGATLAGAGLVQGSGGNLSARVELAAIVTRSGAPLHALDPADFVTVPLGTAPDQWADLEPKPTSEIAMHLAAYDVRLGARVVVHVHPPLAIGLGALGHSLPALTPDFYLHLGAEVPLVPYETPTTDALASALRQPLRQAPAALLQNHGVIVTGSSLEQVALRVRLLEEHAGIMLAALPVGEPRRLTAADQRALDERTGGRYRVAL